MTNTISLKVGTTEDDDACLLNYLPSTYPVPIQTGTGQTPAQAVLNTAALPGKQAVYCNQIVIAVPVGTDVGDLFQQTPTASLNTGKWAVTATVELKKGHELWLDDEIDYATFTFDCRDPSDFLINYNLVLGVSGAVAPDASECTVEIMENSGTTGDPSKFTNKYCSYTVATSTPQFYLTNFATTATGSPTVPATQFDNGADINLAWESNGTFFQLFEKNQPKPVYAGTQTTFTLKGGVKTDTTFVLVAMVSGDPSGDKPQSGYQPIYLYDALTVTVSNPDLTPNSSNIAGALTVKGAATLANATVGGTLGVGGTLNVTGATGLANASVGGALGVGTNAPLNKLHVIAPGGFGGENSDGTAQPGNVPIVAQSDNTAFGIINGKGRQAFALNIDGDGGTPSARGVPTFYDKYDGNWRASLSLRNGCVGIGTNNPTQALLVVNGAGPGIAANQYGYLNNRDPTGFWNAPQQVQYSIWASYRIASVEFNAFSDERIKNVLGRSDSAADLRTLLSLEVTDYRHKDAVGKGNAPQKKLVAQQVEQVFPQAVGKTTDAVPDIYRPAPCTDGWVELATDLKAGERVRLIADRAEGVYEVLEATPDRFRTEFKPESEKVFVYGREVNDFRTLDYDAVSMLNVSATQQLKRENDALAEKLERLERKLESALSLLATAAGGAGRKLL